jgi:arsenate reductase
MLNVLILCTGNSARSIMAEAIFDRLGQGKIRAYSAGSTPKGRVHPLAIALLQSQAYDTSSMRSKSWDEFAAHDAPRMDIVITVCDNAANETCPVWPGEPIQVHWSIPDPDQPDLLQEQQQRGFQAAYDQLEYRIRQFMELDLDDIDAKVLLAKLKEIGGSEITLA